MPLVPASRTLQLLRPLIQTRARSNLAPQKVKWPKRFKGVIPIRTGGSTRGTTLAFGTYGIRIISNGVRISAKQLTAAQEALKRNLKPLKGSRFWLRTFPDVPVCVKGNETRMGRGKGLFEYWATRVATGRVIFEIGGCAIREEVARDALRQASDKLPCVTEFITRYSPPRLGNILIVPEGYIMKGGKMLSIKRLASLSERQAVAEQPQIN